MKNNCQLKTEAKTENLASVLAFVAANIAGAPPRAQKHIEMAVEEVFVNISSYAYHPETGAVSVRVSIDKDVVNIEFRDGGVPYNPLLKDDPDITLPGEKRQAGGLGIFMVKQLMDNVAYRREGDMNILTISKAAA
ncbi:MAG: ATP-binding protein [Desulfarculales bacterium]|jgi:anti-sigma regulatory factor (Ser/Thr protein kinase)|nr:ATP-binding protein [Desulfarculales bacterium]